MRHIYVKTPDGFGKLSFYKTDPHFGDYNYIVEHYNHDPIFYTGEYNKRFIVNARVYRRKEIQYIKRRPLIDLITKRKKG